MSFTTLDTVALYLNKMSSLEFTPLETAQLSMLITQVDGIIQNYCGWPIMSTTFTAKTLSGNGETSIGLEAYPLTAITSVIMDDEDILSIVEHSNTDGYLTTTDDSTLTSGTDNITITYTAGFVDGSIPADLTYAATYLVILNYKRINAEIFGISKAKFVDDEYEFESSNLPTLVQNVLDRYMLVAIR